jgi:predicted nuclease with TOPRIM domain
LKARVQELEDLVEELQEAIAAGGQQAYIEQLLAEIAALTVQTAQYDEMVTSLQDKVAKITLVLSTLEEPAGLNPLEIGLIAATGVLGIGLGTVTLIMLSKGKKKIA